MFSISFIAVLLQNPGAGACLNLRAPVLLYVCVGFTRLVFTMFICIHLSTATPSAPNYCPSLGHLKKSCFFFKNVLVAPAPLRIQSFRKRTKNVNVLETHAKPMVLHGFDVLDVFVSVLDRRRRFC